MPRPSPSEFFSFYKTYIDKSVGTDAVQELVQSLNELTAFLHALPPAKADYAYAPGKWSLKQVLQHCIDTERIMAYRALSIARGETQNLPGFDENGYAQHATAEHRNMADLTQEFLQVRQSSILLFQSFLPLQIQTMGSASQHPISVNALGFIIVGHALHHTTIITDRYI